MVFLLFISGDVTDARVCAREGCESVRAGSGAIGAAISMLNIDNDRSIPSCVLAYDIGTQVRGL
jgi:hypothetical protein